MVYLLVTKAQIEGRLSKRRVARLYDDNDDGKADDDPVDRLRADASSKILSYLEPMGILPQVSTIFDPTTGEVALTKTVPSEMVRLALDVVVALAAQRFPEAMRQDWVPLMKQVDSDLKAVREGRVSLGLPNPPATLLHGAALVGEGEITTNAAGACAPVSCADSPRCAGCNCWPCSCGRWGDMGGFA